MPGAAADSQSMVQGWLESLEPWLEMCILSSHSRPTELISGGGAQKNQFQYVFQMILTLTNHLKNLLKLC